MRTNLICALALFALGVVTPSFAEPYLKANIPFDFEVGKNVMRAGEYRFDVDATSGLIWIEGAESGTRSVIGSFTAGGGPERSGESKIVFSRYGSAYYLSELWRDDRTVGRKINFSRRESEMARNTSPAPVAILASNR